MNGEARLDDLQIPIAQLAPEKLVDRAGGLIKTVVRQRLVYLSGHAIEARVYPAVLEVTQIVFCNALRQTYSPNAVQIHEDKARGVPDLVGKCAIAFRAIGVERNVGSRRRHGSQREAHCVRAVFLRDLDWVDHVALGLRHLLPVSVTHQSVNVNLAEGHAALGMVRHEVAAEHNHACHPEEQDVETSDQQ